MSYYRDRAVTFESHIATLVLTRILRPYRRSKAFHIIVLLPENVSKIEWFAVAEKLFLRAAESAELDLSEFSSTTSTGKVLLVEAKTPGTAAAARHERVLSLVIYEAHERIDAVARAGATDVVSLGALTADIVQRAAEVHLKRKLPLDVAERLAEMSSSDRDYLMRRGVDTVRAVRSLPVASAEPPPAASQKSSSPRLEELHGYGDAKTWGLQLAKDLRDYREGVISWDDVDRGMLLSGPPGCGKTTFAAALAETCGVHLELASYARWYGRGSGQGDLVKSMRDSFKRASDAAPAIMFIDEIDSFGDRDKQPDWHAEWSRQIVNALLECVDGAGGREGVVVVGACNNPSIVDPAIKRSGRLDRHISIPLPDAEARGAILRWHLQGDVAVGEAVMRTEGMSGADLERIARDARRVARRERRNVTAADVLAALPERKSYPAEYLRASAVHEAGHAVVGVALGIEGLRGVWIEASYDPKAILQSAGSVEWSADLSGMRDRTHYEEMITMTLGGLAAETAILGGHGDGVSHDLAQASVWAAAMVGSYGMHGRLVSIGDVDAEAITRALRSDPELAESADRILQAQRARATEVVEQYRDVIEALAERLLREQRVEGRDVVEMVRQARACDRVRAV